MYSQYIGSWLIFGFYRDIIFNYIFFFILSINLKPILMMLRFVVVQQVAPTLKEACKIAISFNHTSRPRQGTVSSNEWARRPTAVMRSRTRGAVDIYREPKIAAMGRYITYARLDGPYFANFADADAKSRPHPAKL